MQPGTFKPSDDRIIDIDVLGAFRRRKWIGISIGVLGVVATYFGVAAWPATYQSTATILIEEPDVPSDLVKSTVSDFANERLQIIQQRVMTSQNLNEIIDKYKLYESMPPGLPKSAMISIMRSRITLQVVSANLTGQPQSRTRPQPQATIAFNLSFESENPTIAQQVTNTLTDLYLAENNKTRQQKAAGASQFLTEQAKKLYAEVQTLEKRLTELKSKYNGSLPEQFNFNMQMLNQAQSRLMENTSELQELREKRAFLQSQLGQVSPHMPLAMGDQPATPQAQLMVLQMQYADFSTRYGSKHPDVVRLKRQIETLRGQLGGVDTSGFDRTQYATVQAQLNDALQRYGEQHPDVQRLRRQLNELSAQMNAPQLSMSVPEGPPNNPVYIQLQNQLGESEAQIRGLENRVAGLQANIDDLQKRILESPNIEGEYNSVRDQYQAALQRYQSFKDKEADAAVAENMELQGKGKTFSVIEPAQYPDVPLSPNRRLLQAVGFFLTAVLAIAAMVARDMLDPRIYEAKNLLQAFGEMPLATVPYIGPRGELRSRHLRRAAGVAALSALTAGAIAAASANFTFGF